MIRFPFWEKQGRYDTNSTRELVTPSNKCRKLFMSYIYCKKTNKKKSTAERFWCVLLVSDVSRKPNLCKQLHSRIKQLKLLKGPREENWDRAQTGKAQPQAHHHEWFSVLRSNSFNDTIWSVELHSLTDGINRFEPNVSRHLETWYYIIYNYHCWNKKRQVRRRLQLTIYILKLCSQAWNRNKPLKKGNTTDPQNCLWKRIFCLEDGFLSRASFIIFRAQKAHIRFGLLCTLARMFH